jgi:hypothetical protein
MDGQIVKFKGNPLVSLSGGLAGAQSQGEAQSQPPAPMHTGFAITQGFLSPRKDVTDRERWRPSPRNDRPLSAQPATALEQLSNYDEAIRCSGKDCPL